MSIQRERRPKTDTDGNPLRKRMEEQATAIPNSYDPNKTDQVHKEVAGKELVKFVDHDGGFLKVRRALDSDDLHLTWTWSVGSHAGKYVYVRVLAWQVGYGLALLHEKLLECEEGNRKPTVDKLGHR